MAMVPDEAVIGREEEWRLTDAQVDAAVDWWAKALCQPKFDTLGETRHDPKADPKGAVSMAELMASSLHQAPSEEQMSAFRDALREQLLSGDTYLSVDYWPSAALGNALEAAGIEVKMSSLPWKTHMNFDRGGVTVSCGYGAPWETLLAKQEAETDEN